MPLGTPITVRFEDEELAALKERADAEERPLGFIVRKACREFLSLSKSGRHPGANGGIDSRERAASELVTEAPR